MAVTDTVSLDIEKIPVVDIGPLVDGSNPAAAAKSLVWAATEVGFIYAKNHGIPQATIDRARQAGLDFFREPLAVKEALKSNIHHHGYLRPGATKMYDDAKVDLKESYNYGLELDADALAKVADNSLLGPNRWPPKNADFRAAMLDFFAAASGCAQTLLRGFAIGRGLPSETFVKHVDQPVSRGSLQYYPPRPDDAGEDDFSLAPHTDFGVLTVLAQDDVGGLQIQGLDGTWLAAPPIPGTIVVNVGDLLGRWSNDVFRSTPHRVINASGRERLSLVLAFDPNAQTEVDPSLFCAAGETPKYDATTVGDYLVWRFGKAFSYRK